MAKRCTFHVAGDVESYIDDEMTNCIVNIEGYGKQEHRKTWVTGCTFKTSNPETLKNFLKYVPKKHNKNPTGNKIVFIEDGKETVVRDYGSID